jgi:hypothetical protein
MVVGAIKLEITGYLAVSVVTLLLHLVTLSSFFSNIAIHSLTP